VKAQVDGLSRKDMRELLFTGHEMHRFLVNGEEVVLDGNNDFVTLCRSKSANVVVLAHGLLRVDLESRECHLASEVVDLTRTEFDVLATLMGRTRVVFTRKMIIDEIWAKGWFRDQHVIDVHISNIRRKLRLVCPSGIYVHTVRGVGFRMADLQLM
jgi:DNA-binding response OmpR family regulator